MRPVARVTVVPAFLLAAACGLSPALRAQDAATVIQVADRDRAALNPSGALGRLDAGLATAPANYDLLWRASREAADLGETASDAAKRAEYFRRAEGYARRAVTANAGGADGHFVLAVALGRTALSLGSRDRVRYAGEIRSEALTALKLDPKHAGALHVLGVWNAEVMRLSSFSRFAARNFLGGKVFDQASWAEATRYLEEAVAVDPGRLTHRLDLAKVYAETKQQPKARATCDAALKMPVVELNDAHYKQECERLLATLR
jgi:tetratricopeptide (TPR) repeat protein